MDKATAKWFHRLCRLGDRPSHDDFPELTDKLIALGVVEIVKTWEFNGKKYRLIRRS